MGLSYDELDHYILTGKGEPKIKEKIEKLAAKNKHKMDPIPIPQREILLT